MPKYRITFRWHHTGLGDKPKGPAGEEKTVEIDTEKNMAYDGANGTEEVKEVFLSLQTPDPLHRVELRIEKASVV